MKAYDAIVVGGGPAGSTAASRLHQAGARVLVVDQCTFPRDKPCAGWITPQTAAALQLDLDDYSRDHTLQPIRGFRCGTIGGREIEVRYDQVISYGIRRREFDAYLLQRCQADQQLGQSVTSISRTGSIWTINDEWTAPVLVGAGGTHCPVARLLGARPRHRTTCVVAQECEFQFEPLLDGGAELDVPLLYFCQDLAGYGWCFRKGSYWNIGLGRTDPAGLPRHVVEFTEFLRSRGVTVPMESASWKGHSYALYDSQLPVLLDDGVVLVGDAAGLAYGQSGEGIRPAVESALMAAETIIAAAGHYDRNQLIPYQSRVVARFGTPQRSSWLSAIPSSWRQSLGLRLITNSWFARHVILDQWFLHRDQPAYRTRVNERSASNVACAG
ncbi:MAG: NAD(P)/FAD-dependent oxidoreductase [Pirellulales bacterium]